MNDKDFYRFLDHLGLSRRGNRKDRKGTKKRLARHMISPGCRDVQTYLERWR